MRKYLPSLFLALVFLLLNPLPGDAVQLEEERPEVHILMPVYNASPFILTSLESVLGQTYPEKRLLIWDDGSTDDTVAKIQSLNEKNTGKAHPIVLKSSSFNKGVAFTRTELVKWSKELNMSAYILWLDADDSYTDFLFIEKIIHQMQVTQADIGLFNFSIHYENEHQKINAVGLLKDQEAFTCVLETISSTFPPLYYPFKLFSAF